MTRIYHDKDADLSLITEKRIAVVGYGSQAHAHALNLRDSRVKDVCVALRAASPSIAAAEDAGLSVMTPADAAAWADVVVMLTPDETQAEIYANEIAPHMKKGASLVFAHGFNVHFGFIKPRADLDVWMVAPKDVGPMVRAHYQKGSGVPCLIAVAQNVSGKAHDLALAYGAAIGCGRVGMFETNFGEECEVDLFGEQAVLFGGLPPLMRAAYETLVGAGYAPEVAYFKCVQQVKLVADAIAARGMAGMNEIISNTAEYGGYVAEPHLVNETTRKEMQKLLTQIQNGSFARDWMEEHKGGQQKLLAARAKVAAHPLEKIGAALRKLIR